MARSGGRRHTHRAGARIIHSSLNVATAESSFFSSIFFATVTGYRMWSYCPSVGVVSKPPSQKGATKGAGEFRDGRCTPLSELLEFECSRFGTSVPYVWVN